MVIEQRFLTFRNKATLIEVSNRIHDGRVEPDGINYDIYSKTFLMQIWLPAYAKTYYGKSLFGIGMSYIPWEKYELIIRPVIEYRSQIKSPPQYLVISRLKYLHRESTIEIVCQYAALFSVRLQEGGMAGELRATGHTRTDWTLKNLTFRCVSRRLR